MWSRRARTTLIVLLAAAPACRGVRDAAPPPAGRGEVAAPAPKRAVLFGAAAKAEIDARAGQGRVNDDRTQDGVRTTKLVYPDGGLAQVTAGPGRAEYAFWTPPR